jgi:hypothetical protein
MRCSQKLSCATIVYMPCCETWSDVSQDLLKHGEQKRMREALALKMQQLLPENAYLLCSDSKTPSSQAHYHVTHPEHGSAQCNSSSSSRTAGTSNSSSSTGDRGAVGQAPCVLGATRVRPCCPSCVQPDVFEGEFFQLSDSETTGLATPVPERCSQVDPKHSR